ncbi:MAG: PEGA domain-containing protein [Myxococcota bacterium]
MDRPEAATLLAHGLRLRGLTHLYFDKDESAGKDFAQAFFLDAEFTPEITQWPPKARLAYADTVAHIHRGPRTNVSIDVSPSTAMVWLDGRTLGEGSRTVSDLPVGTHMLLAKAPGFASQAMTLDTANVDSIQRATLPLKPLAPEAAQASILSFLAQQFIASQTTLQTQQSYAIRALSEHLDVNAVLIVMPTTMLIDSTTSPRWLLFAHEGQLLGHGHLSADHIAERQIVHHLLLADPLAAEAKVQTAMVQPWYRSWVLWTVVGVAVVGATSAGVLLAPHETKERMTFFIGGR